MFFHIDEIEMLKFILQFLEGEKRNKEKYLFTLGYEGLNREGFVRQLKQNNIKILADVREIAWSRKRGFSKAQLATILSQNRIRYIHYKELGSPLKLRKKVKATSNYKQFFDEYSDYLSSQKEHLQSLSALVDKTACCLLCFEKSSDTCHRKIIASEIRKMDGNGLKVVHL